MILLLRLAFESLIGGCAKRDICEASPSAFIICAKFFIPSAIVMLERLSISSRYELRHLIRCEIYARWWIIGFTLLSTLRGRQNSAIFNFQINLLSSLREITTAPPPLFSFAGSMDRPRGNERKLVFFMKLKTGPFGEDRCSLARQWSRNLRVSRNARGILLFVPSSFIIFGIILQRAHRVSLTVRKLKIKRKRTWRATSNSSSSRRKTGVPTRDSLKDSSRFIRLSRYHRSIIKSNLEAIY